MFTPGAGPGLPAGLPDTGPPSERDKMGRRERGRERYDGDREKRDTMGMGRKRDEMGRRRDTMGMQRKRASTRGREGER